MKLFNTKGSLLVEALLATVILSVSITVIIQSMLSSYRAAVYTSQYSKAIMALDNEMGLVIKENISPEESVEYFYDAEDSFSFDLKKKPVEGDLTGLLEENTLSVSWTSGKKRSNIDLQTYLFVPLDDE